MRIDEITIRTVALAIACLACVRPLWRLPVPSQLGNLFAVIGIAALGAAGAHALGPHLAYPLATEVAFYALLLVGLIAAPFVTRRFAGVVQSSADETERARREYERALADYRTLVYHRMFNPLTVIKGMAQTLVDRPNARPEDVASMCEHIVEQARRLEHVTADPSNIQGPEEAQLQPVPDVSRSSRLLARISTANTIDLSAPAFRREGLLQRVGPFIATAFVTIATMPLFSGAVVVGNALAAAALLTLLLTVLVFTINWDVLARGFQLMLPLGGLGVVALVRHAGGGGAAATTALVIAPVFYMALYGSRREFEIVMAATVLMFVAPIMLLGSPQYPPTEWLRTLLWLLMLTVVGTIIQALVGRARAEAANAAAGSAKALQASELLQTTIDRLPYGIIGLDPDGRIVFVNMVAERLIGYRADELLGRSMHSALHDRQRDGTLCPEATCPMHGTLPFGTQPRDDFLWGKSGDPIEITYMRSERGADGSTIAFHTRSATGLANTSREQSNGASRPQAGKLHIVT